MSGRKRSPAAVIVAHPDDETIWAGGALMDMKEHNWFVAVLTRASDSDRAPKFARALEYLGAEGKLADLDDGPDQNPLGQEKLSRAILELLPQKKFDLILTHNANGEYQRHRRHEEVSKAVTSLWQRGIIRSKALWSFDYRFDEANRISRPAEEADVKHELSDTTRARKRFVMTGIYGFDRESFEVRTLPEMETFRRLTMKPAKPADQGEKER